MGWMCESLRGDKGWVGVFEKEEGRVGVGVGVKEEALGRVETGIVEEMVRIGEEWTRWASGRV